MFQLYRWFSIRDVDIKAVRLISKKPGNLLSDCGVSVIGPVCMSGPLSVTHILIFSSQLFAIPLTCVSSFPKLYAVVLHCVRAAGEKVRILLSVESHSVMKVLYKSMCPLDTRYVKKEVTAKPQPDVTVARFCCDD